MASRKLIELLIDEDTENFGVEAISLVKYPAIESNFIHFSKDQGMREMYAMAKVDADKRTLIGPALIPDKNIPRFEEMTGEEYDVYFSKDTVQKASELFLKNNYANNHTFEHEKPIDGVSVVESWIVTNPEMDKARHFGLEVPEGTWMVRVHVANDEMWQFVKENKVSGFSIEGYFVDRVENMSERKKPEEGIVRKIQQMLRGRKLYAEVQTNEGHTFATEADEFTSGVDVYKIGPEGTALEVQNGLYKTKAGTTFEVFEGVITDWDGDTKQVEEEAKKEEMSKLKEEMRYRFEKAMEKVQRRKFNRIMEVVADLGPDYELVTNSQDIQAWFDTIGYEDLYGDAGCLFVSFDDPEGGIEGYRVFICEDTVPRDNSYVYELYPNNEYT